MDLGLSYDQIEKKFKQFILFNIYNTINNNDTNVYTINILNKIISRNNNFFNI